jgi:hypothetical protein
MNTAGAGEGALGASSTCHRRAEQEATPEKQAATTLQAAPPQDQIMGTTEDTSKTITTTRMRGVAGASKNIRKDTRLVINRIES